MQHLVLLIATGALLCQCGCQAANVNRNMRSLQMVISNVDNSIETRAAPTKRLGLKKFVHITKRPPTTIKHTGDGILEIKCEAMGSPAPTVQWLRNDVPILEFDQESNELVDTPFSSIARVTSTLIVKPSDHFRDMYTCLVTSGQRVTKATTTVYTIDKNSDFSERYRLLPFEPKVVASFKVYMDTIGNNVVLPCRVKGHPRPKVSWTDNNGEVIRGNPRMKVLRSGELVITNLRWSDMGEFQCRASNLFGNETAKTFVYPVAG